MKLELRKNMYYRTYSGSINKITSIKDFNEREYHLNGFYVNKDTIKKASYNIIDILEVGDYVNGSWVNEFVDNKPIHEDYNDPFYSFGWENEDIKTVITHEQMEQMAYKVGE